MKKKHLIAISITFIILIIPVCVGVLVSLSVWPKVSTSNDWIGFWGGYAGSIVGGVITLTVMWTSLQSNKKMQDLSTRQKLCDNVAQLVSIFCRELLAYRGRWNALYQASNGGAIDQEKKLQYDATSEGARQPFFQLDMMVRHISEAKTMLSYMERLLNDTKFTSLSVAKADEKLKNLRAMANDFIVVYSKRT